VVIYEGATRGANRLGAEPAAPWEGAVVGITEKLQDTTVDAVIAGHTHRAANTSVGRIPVVEGFNAGVSYSVLQLMVKNGEVAWIGAANRTAKNLGVEQRPDVKAIVDAATAEVQDDIRVVIGSQAKTDANPSGDILRAPGRDRESAMGNMVADAMRLAYVDDGAEAAITNSGGLRADLPFAGSANGGADGQITWGEMFAVLPFGNATVVETLTGAQLVQAFTNGFSAVCNTQISTGRFPAVSGLVVRYHCNGTQAVVDSIAKAPNGPSGPLTPVGPADTVRFVTNDFMYNGGDGYTVFGQGTDVLQTGDLLLDVAINYVTANSPVAPVVENRIVTG
jgi:2',3'-cyclic-nucleotide 2'-phosphodiesterase (5'-nucleotidase family)